MATKYRVQTGEFTVNGKPKYRDATGTVKFQLDPPAAPKEDKSTTVNAKGTVLSDADKEDLLKMVAALAK